MLLSSPLVTQSARAWIPVFQHPPNGRARQIRSRLQGACGRSLGSSPGSRRDRWSRGRRPLPHRSMSHCATPRLAGRFPDTPNIARAARPRPPARTIPPVRRTSRQCAETAGNVAEPSGDQQSGQAHQRSPPAPLLVAALVHATIRYRFRPHRARRRGSSGSARGSCSPAPAGAGRTRRTPVARRRRASPASLPPDC